MKATALAWLSYLWDEACWRFDEWWAARRHRLSPAPSAASPEDPYVRYLVNSGLAWYADFFKANEDSSHRPELEDLYIRTWPALQALDYFREEEWAV